MDIGTANTQVSILNAMIGSTQGGSAQGVYGLGQAGAASQGGGGASSFGPSAILDIGQSQATSSDYSALGAMLGTGSAKFDLNAALQLGMPTATAPQRSEEEVAAEKAVVGQALELANLAEYDKAETLLDEALEGNSQSGTIVHGLATLALMREDYERAEDLFQRAAYLSPEAGYESDVDNARFLQFDDDKVLAHGKRLVANSKTREDGVRLLYNLTQRSASFTEARIELAEALLDSGDAVNGLQQYNRAIVTAEEGDLGELETRLRSLVEEAPEAAFVRQLLGKTQLRQGRYAEAEVTLATASDLADGGMAYANDRARAMVGLGHELLDRGDLAGAVTKFEQAEVLARTATEVKRGLAAGYLARAEFKLRVGSREQAIADYKLAATKLGSGGDEATRKRIALGSYTAGLVLQRQHERDGEDIDAEVTAYQTAYDLDKGNKTYKRKLAEARNALGDQYMADEEYSQAAGAYYRAYRLYKGNETYKANAVNAYVHKGDDELAADHYDEAIDAYRRAYDIDRYDETAKARLAEGYNARGLDYLDQGKKAQAAADFKEALELFPDNATYQANWDSVKYFYED